MPLKSKNFTKGDPGGGEHVNILVHRWMKFFLELLSYERIGHAEQFFSLHLPWSTIISEGAETSIVRWYEKSCSLELSTEFLKMGFLLQASSGGFGMNIHNGVPPRKCLLLSSECPFSSDLIMFQVGVHHINAATTLLIIIFRRQNDHLFNWNLSNNSFSCHAWGSTFTTSAVLCTQLRWQCKKTDQKHVPLHSSEQLNSSILLNSSTSS